MTQNISRESNPGKNYGLTMLSFRFLFPQSENFMNKKQNKNSLISDDCHTHTHIYI
jgi:hypothetical protein